MNKKQQYLLGMLIEIDAICKKNDIQYFLVGGSLIGALRSEGFLPWDDDADICMTYDNYVKFKKACETDLPPNRILAAPELQEDCGVMIPRYTSCDTTLIHTAQSLHDCTAGEVIDVFVLDPVADDESSYQKYVANVCMTHEMSNYASITANRYDVPYETYLKYAAIKKEKGKLAVCQQLEEEKQECFDENGSRYVFRWQGCLISYPRCWFENTVEVTFEGYRFPAPIEYNDYLTAYFGEEWAELPGNINPAKHNASASLDFPSSQALEYYRPSMDREKLRSRLWERKRLVLETAEQVNRFKDEVAEAQAVRIQLELEKHLANVKDQFDQAYAAKDGRTLASLLEDYLRNQTDRSLIGRHAYDDIYRFRKPVLAHVSDKVYEAALWAFMETERMRFAQRFLDIREQMGLPLTSAMAEVRQALKLFRSSCNCYVHGDLETGLGTALLICRRHPHVSAFLKLVTVFLNRLQENGDESAEARFKTAIEAGMTLYPWDGFFLKMEGDLLYSLGEVKAAQSCYLVAAESTRNGFALLDIRKRTGYWPAWMRESSWGKSYGIPAWEGEGPKGQLSPRERIAAPDAAPSPQRYLYGLLKELTGLCDSLGVDYHLSNEAQSALMTYGKLPSSLQDYSIVCSKAGVERLAKAVDEGKLPHRSLERTLNVMGQADDALYIHGDDSLYLNMGTVLTNPFNSLYVTVKQAGGSPADPDSTSPLKTVVGKIKQALMPRAKLKGPIVKENDQVSGCSFSVLQGAAPKGKCPSDTFRTGPNELVSTIIAADEFMKTGAVPQDFFKRKRELKPKTAQIAKIQKEFKENFRQVKLAVQLKQLSLVLLPKKEEILRMKSEGDTKGVAQALRPYAKLAKTFKGVGDVCFDQELYTALQETME